MNGCLSKILTGNTIFPGALLSSSRGLQENIFTTDLAGFLLWLSSYQFCMCVTSKYLSALPWLAVTFCTLAGLPLCVDGFCTTSPNAAKAAGSRLVAGMVRLEIDVLIVILRAADEGLAQCGQDDSH